MSSKFHIKSTGCQRLFEQLVSCTYLNSQFLRWISKGSYANNQCGLLKDISQLEQFVHRIGISDGDTVVD